MVRRCITTEMDSIVWGRKLKTLATFSNQSSLISFIKRITFTNNQCFAEPRLVFGPHLLSSIDINVTSASPGAPNLHAPRSLGGSFLNLSDLLCYILPWAPWAIPWKRARGQSNVHLLRDFLLQVGVVRGGGSTSSGLTSPPSTGVREVSSSILQERQNLHTLNFNNYCDHKSEPSDEEETEKGLKKRIAVLHLEAYECSKHRSHAARVQGKVPKPCRILFEDCCIAILDGNTVYTLHLAVPRHDRDQQALAKLPKKKDKNFNFWDKDPAWERFWLAIQECSKWSKGHNIDKGSAH